MDELSYAIYDVVSDRYYHGNGKWGSGISEEFGLTQRILDMVEGAFGTGNPPSSTNPGTLEEKICAKACLDFIQVLVEGYESQGEYGLWCIVKDESGLDAENIMNGKLQLGLIPDMIKKELNGE